MLTSSRPATWAEVRARFLGVGSVTWPAPVYTPLSLPSLRKALAMTTLTITDFDGDTLTIAQAPRIGEARDGGALVHVKPSPDGVGSSIGVFVSREEAPEVALAILKAAGYSDSSHSGPVESAVASLASIGKKKEAAAKLDAHALELYNAGARRIGDYAIESLDEIPEEHAEGWRAVVKHARKLAAQEASA